MEFIQRIELVSEPYLSEFVYCEDYFNIEISDIRLFDNDSIFTFCQLYSDDPKYIEEIKDRFINNTFTDEDLEIFDLSDDGYIMEVGSIEDEETKESFKKLLRELIINREMEG